MTELRRAQKLVRDIIAQAQQAEALARRGRTFAEQAEAAVHGLDSLREQLKLSRSARERLARSLETQGEQMKLAMVLGGLLSNGARELRATERNRRVAPMTPAPR